MAKRILIVAVTVLIMFTAISVRLAQLSVANADELSAMATAQQQRSFDYYQYARADIIDCMGESFTGRVRECLLVVPIPAAETRALVTEKLSKILSYNSAAIAARMEAGGTGGTPFILAVGLDDRQISAVRQANLPGVLTAPLAARYDGCAAQLIGSVQPATDGLYRGASGLELQYDALLSKRIDTQVIATVDARGALSSDTLYMQAAAESSHVDLQLTLRRDYQLIVERAFAELGYQGAGVVMNPLNGDLLAAASVPSYDQYGWMAAEDGAYVNKVFSLYPPASTFKMLLSIAALEENCNLPAGELVTADGDMTDSATADATAEPALCRGSHVLTDGRVVYCSAALDGHGKLDLARALAVSCNCYFVALGEELGGDVIKTYAARFGLMEQQLDGYSLPELPSDAFISFSSALPGELANACLGEDGVSLSPVQLAVLTSCCVNGGYRVYPRLVSGTVDQSGNSVSEYPARLPDKIISADTAEIMRQMLVDAVKSGTAISAAGDYVSAGGKTGSSETGCVWFCGFAPTERAQWVVTVCVENGTAGGREAAAVFKRIIDDIARLEG